MAAVVTRMLDEISATNDFTVEGLISNNIYNCAAALILSDSQEACNAFSNHPVFERHPTALARIRTISSSTTARGRTPAQEFVFTTYMFIHH
jgi:hypothetical protein